MDIASPQSPQSQQSQQTPQSPQVSVGPVAVPEHRRRFPSLRVILREPFRAATWRRVAYLFLALPVGLLCIPVALVGGPVGRIQLALMGGVLGRNFKEFEARERAGVLGVVHAVISVPLNLVAAVVIFYCWFVVAINLGFPLRIDNDPTQSWGGPTMAGAWAVHVLGGVGTFLFLSPWIAKGFTAVQVRLAAGLLGRDRSGLGRSVALALGVAALCGLLSVPIIHQL